MKRTAVAFVAGVLIAPAIYATNHQKPEAGDSEPRGSLSQGEVRKVDKEAQKITIRHGPLANLDMPAMTMVFRVKDPAMLDQVKAGDKIKFQAEKVGGDFTVMQLKPAQ
jgi:Cu(I)/Ag(I) efflux system protein CusF